MLAALVQSSEEALDKQLGDNENMAPTACPDSSEHPNGVSRLDATSRASDQVDSNDRARSAVLVKAHGDATSCQAAPFSHESIQESGESGAVQSLGERFDDSFESPNRASPDMLAAFAEAVACMRPSPSPCVSPFRRSTSRRESTSGSTTGRARTPSMQRPSSNSIARNTAQQSTCQGSTVSMMDIDSGRCTPLSPPLNVRPTKIALNELFEQSMGALQLPEGDASPTLGSSSSPPLPHYLIGPQLPERDASPTLGSSSSPPAPHSPSGFSPRVPILEGTATEAGPDGLSPHSPSGPHPRVPPLESTAIETGVPDGLSPHSLTNSHPRVLTLETTAIGAGTDVMSPRSPSGTASAAESPSNGEDSESAWRISAQASREADLQDESPRLSLDESSPALSTSPTLTDFAESLDG